MNFASPVLPFILFHCYLLLNTQASTLREEQQCTSASKDIDPLNFYHDVALEQLKPWIADGIDSDTLRRAQALGRRYSATQYQIVDGRLYRSQDCLFSPRCKGIEHFLLKIVKDLPNMEFVVNTHDFPLSKNMSDPLPIFSFSIIPGKHFDILYPNWAFWEGGPWLKEIPTWRWDVNRRELLEAADEMPWSEKEDVVFFRGSRTNSDRDSHVLHSYKNASLFDVKFTLNQSQRTTEYVEQTLGITPAPKVTPLEHCKYRYLLNFDGVAASFRLRNVLACGSTVLYVNPTWVEFYYAKLNAWEHYIPLDLDAEKTQEVLYFLRSHPELPQRIATNGRKFIEHHLTMDHIERHWFHVLQSYASLQRFKIERNATFLFLS